MLIHIDRRETAQSNDSAVGAASGDVHAKETLDIGNGPSAAVVAQDRRGCHERLTNQNWRTATFAERLQIRAKCRSCIEQDGRPALAQDSDDAPVLDAKFAHKPRLAAELSGRDADENRQSCQP